MAKKKPNETTFPVLWAKDGRAEDVALVAFLTEIGATVPRAEEFELGREKLRPGRDVVWKLFAGRLWPVTVAAKRGPRTWHPQPESGEDEDGVSYEDNTYNYNVWDDLAPLVDDRPFLAVEGAVLVGFDEAMKAEIRRALGR